MTIPCRPLGHTKAEVTEKLGVQMYIVSLWEKQFGIQALITEDEPLYSAEDLAKLSSIKELLYEKGFTIDAAKQYLQENPIVQGNAVMVASPLLFESKKEAKKIDANLNNQLVQLRHQLIKLRQQL